MSRPIRQITLAIMQLRCSVTLDLSAAVPHGRAQGAAALTAEPPRRRTDSGMIGLTAALLPQAERRRAGAASQFTVHHHIDGAFDPSDGTRGTRGAARARFAGVPAALPRRRCPTRRCRTRRRRATGRTSRAGAS